MRYFHLILFMVVVAMSPAFSWGLATHAFFADKMGKSRHFQNYNEIYGALLRDVFVDDFQLLTEQERYLFLASYTWGFPGNENFLKIWDAAKRCVQTNIAYGFVINNNVWGFDVTANHSGLTHGQNSGWAVQKAVDFIPLAGDLGIWEEMQLDPASPEHATICLSISHWIVDFSSDILIKRTAPDIGRKILKASLYRSNAASRLLTRAIGKEYETYIQNRERAFRQLMILYGAALMLDENPAIDAVAFFLSQRFSGWAAALGLPLPETIQSITKKAIIAALPLLEPDFIPEIDANLETIPDVLMEQGIRY